MKFIRLRVANYRGPPPEFGGLTPIRGLSAAAWIDCSSIPFPPMPDQRILQAAVHDSQRRPVRYAQDPQTFP